MKIYSEAMLIKLDKDVKSIIDRFLIGESITVNGQRYIRVTNKSFMLLDDFIAIRQMRIKQ